MAIDADKKNLELVGGALLVCSSAPSSMFGTPSFFRPDELLINANQMESKIHGNALSRVCTPFTFVSIRTASSHRFGCGVLLGPDRLNRYPAKEKTIGAGSRSIRPELSCAFFPCLVSCLVCLICLIVVVCHISLRLSIELIVQWLN